MRRTLNERKRAADARRKFTTSFQRRRPGVNIIPGIQGQPGMANYGKPHSNVMGWVLNCGSSVVDGIACGTPGTEDWVDGGEVEYGGTTCTSTSQDCNQPASPNGGNVQTFSEKEIGHTGGAVYGQLYCINLWGSPAAEVYDCTCGGNGYCDCISTGASCNCADGSACTMEEGGRVNTSPNDRNVQTGYPYLPGTTSRGSGTRSRAQVTMTLYYIQNRGDTYITTDIHR